MRSPIWVRLPNRLTSLVEKHVPDAFVFALLALALTAGLGLLQVRPAVIAKGFGHGFFSLLSFTLQMCLILILGHAIAAAAPVLALLDRLSAVPQSAKSAVVFVGFLSMVTAWLNWGFSLLFTAQLARAVARRFAAQGRPVDYRALAAASLLGLGSIWAQGLSGSAALQMATPSALPPGLVGVHIPLSQTIFLWQSIVSVFIEVVALSGFLYLIAPTGSACVTAEALGISLLEPEPPNLVSPDAAPRLARLEHSRLLLWPFLALGAVHIVESFRSAETVLGAISLNLLILVLFLLAAWLYRTPALLERAVLLATPAVGGVILQFPFYGGIAGILAVTGLNERLAGFFVGLASQTTLPPLIAAYSALLGVFVPSGGGKWVIEAPYVLAAAARLGCHTGWMVATYDLGEALANLIQPFWMVPVLGLWKLKVRDVMGYTFVVFLFLCPVVLGLTYFLGKTLL